MREFFQKHGSTLIFIVVMLVCLGFFVQVLALQNGFSSSVNAQAVERAEYHTDRQSMSVKRQTDAVKTKVALFAQTLDGITDARTAADKVRVARTSDYFAGEMFADIMYYADGKLYDYNDEQVTVYPGLAELADAETTMLTGAFQFDNRLMSVGVYAPVSEGALSGIVAVYDVNVLWASDLSQKDNTSVSASEFVLLCRSDGQILRRMTNTDTFDVGPKPVQSGFLSAYVTDETAYKSLTKCIANGTDGSAMFTYGTESYVAVVRFFGKENGNAFLFDVYKLSTVYGRGFEMSTQISGALVGLSLLIVGFGCVFVLDRRKTNKIIYNIEMINEELECATATKFRKDVPELLRRHKNSKFVLVSLRINNYGYLEGRFGDEKAHNLLKHERNILQTSMRPGETYGYSSEGEFLVLLNYRNRKELGIRLGKIYRVIGEFDELPDDDFTITMIFCAYEVESREEKVQAMLDKLKLTESSVTMPNGTFAVHYYADVIGESYSRRAEIESRMESALENSEFHLFYQPKYNLKRGDMDGSEILVRWYDSKKGTYRQPAEFLPVFEENGFIDRLDRFVFFRACENIAETVAGHGQAYPVSVNVSRVTAIQPDFTDYYKRIRTKFNIPENFITLEFTESFAYEDYDYLARIIAELHKAGFLCSLDDFGTGYSSYNVLKTLEMDEIKLDKFFLGKGTSFERDQLLLSSTIDVIKKMGVKVTQEGVETKEDYDRLKALGCDVIQGFYFSRPMKYVDYRKFVKENFAK